MDDLTIQSHRGPYRVQFGSGWNGLEKGLAPQEHLLIDAHVAERHAAALAVALRGSSVHRIDATEANKSLERITDFARPLLEKGIRRDHVLIAIGGGIVQDITAFLASCLLRGVRWRYIPTTLLAQADSCIGSKSSINVGPYKNQVGTFTPPEQVFISQEVLNTLPKTELHSGIGEMIKVHIIGGWEDVRRLSHELPLLLSDRSVLARTIRRSLEIKKVLIEKDEFDKSERLVMNYGHTFGHALESAMDYRIPHGIAVTLGLDLANYVSLRYGFITPEIYDELHSLAAWNYAGFATRDVPLDRFFAALMKDKKNVGQDISLILLRGPGQVFLHRQPRTPEFEVLCREHLLSNASPLLKERV